MRDGSANYLEIEFWGSFGMGEDLMSALRGSNPERIRQRWLNGTAREVITIPRHHFLAVVRHVLTIMGITLNGISRAVLVSNVLAGITAARTSHSNGASHLLEQDAIEGATIYDVFAINPTRSFRDVFDGCKLTMRQIKRQAFAWALLTTVIFGQGALSDTPISPGEPDPEFNQEITGSFTGSDFDDLIALMKQTAISVSGQERGMACDVFKKSCGNQKIYRSARFSEIFFFLEVVNGRLIDLTVDAPTGEIYKFDLSGDEEVKFEYSDRFTLAHSCKLLGSLALLHLTDSEHNGGTIFAYANNVGCPDGEPLRKEHQNIPIKFRYLSLDGATGYSEKE